MFRTLTTALAAIAFLGSSSLVRAESGTDAFLDNSRTGAGYQQMLTTKQVALKAPKSNWMDHASQVIDGGN